MFGGDLLYVKCLVEICYMLNVWWRSGLSSLGCSLTQHAKGKIKVHLLLLDTPRGIENISSTLTSSHGSTVRLTSLPHAHKSSFSQIS